MCLHEEFVECVIGEVCGVCYMRSLWSVLHEKFV